MAVRVAAVLCLVLVLAAGASASRSADEWSVGISADSAVAPGGHYNVTASVTYTYAMWNDSVTLEVSSPLAQAYVGNDDPADCNSSACTFHALSGTKTVTFTYTAPSAPGTSLWSTASSHNGFEPNPTSAPASPTVYTVVSTPPPPVSISASAGTSQVQQNGTISIAVSATNTGSSALSDIWVSNMSGIHWSAESMSQTGGPGFACDHPNAFDTNCHISSFDPGATATFTATETAAPDASIGEILNARFAVFQGASPGGSALASTAVSVQVAAAATTTAPPPATGTAPVVTAATTTQSTTTAPASSVTIATTTQSPTPPPAPLCRVPRLVGLTLAAARAAATRHHCRLTVTYRVRPGARSGRVVSQRAPADVTLVSGARLAVVVSRRAGSRR